MVVQRYPESKTRTLYDEGTLNLHPETVRDELFQENEFFDARDMLQVKYEMLRRVRVEGQSIQQAAEAFGFSRPSFYKAQKAFEKEGLPGLLPKQRGPHGAHKLTDEIMETIVQMKEKEPTIRTPMLAKRIHEQFGLRVHPRSIERALVKRKKKR